MSILLTTNKIKNIKELNERIILNCPTVNHFFIDEEYYLVFPHNTLIVANGVELNCDNIYLRRKHFSENYVIFRDQNDIIAEISLINLKEIRIFIDGE